MGSASFPEGLTVEKFAPLFRWSDLEALAHEYALRCM